jgi:hypothetical protein
MPSGRCKTLSAEGTVLPCPGVSVRVVLTDDRQDLLEREKPRGYHPEASFEPVPPYRCDLTGGWMLAVRTIPARTDIGAIFRVSTRRTAVRLNQTVIGCQAGLRRGSGAPKAGAAHAGAYATRLDPARLTPLGVGRPAGPALGRTAKSVAIPGQGWCR